MPLLFQLAEFSLSPFIILLDAGKRLLPSNCCGSRCHSTWCSWDHQESGMNGVALNEIRVYGWLQCRQRVQGAYTVKNIAGWFFPFFFQLLFFTDLQPDSFPSVRLVIRWVCQGQKNSWSLVSHWNVLYRSSDISKLRSKSLNLLNSHSWKCSAAGNGVRCNCGVTSRCSGLSLTECSYCCFFSQSVISLTSFVSNEAK